MILVGSLSGYMKTILARLGFVCALSSLTAVVGCQSIHGTLPSAVGIPLTSIPGASEYHLQPGDILETRFSADPTLNEQAVVAPDGRVSFLGAPNILAAGLTVPELQHTVLDSARIIDKSFNIALRSSVGVRVYVTGEVTTPGEIIAPGNISALQAVSRAGGLKISAQGGEVVLIRHEDVSKPASVYSVNLTAAANGKTPAEDIWLQPYDIIYVPRDRIGNASLVLERLRNAVPIVFSLVYGSQTPY